MSKTLPEVKNHSAPLALEGGRRPTEKAKGAETHALPSTAAKPEPEVRPHKTRRSFTAKYKLRILDELDRCARTGERGAIIRREGLYSSQITDWRRQRNAGELTSLTNVRGRKKIHDEKDHKIESLEKEIAALKTKLLQAETIIDVQKKVSEIFGINTLSNKHSEAN